MSATVLTLLVRSNLVLAAVILLILALRRPVRHAFGPLAAYLLWLAAPLCLAAVLLPAHETAQAAAPVVALVVTAIRKAAPIALHAPGLAPILIAAWAMGAAALATFFAVRQALFVRSLGRLTPSPADPALLIGEHRGAGPLLLGWLRPRIVAPADFEERFNGPARDLVLAHERVHLARGDATINGLVVLLQCLAWFNPLVHLAARALRIDQEIACDAAVLERHANAHRLYAETLLGTALTPFSAPFGCHWPAAGVHPLKERLMMLKTTTLTPVRKALGAALIGTAALAAAGAVWAASPPAQPTVTLPVWVQRPSGEDMARDYPASAIQDKVVSATAVIDCNVASDGRLQTCTVFKEDPAQYGFGEAAIKLARHFQMAPTSRDGAPTAGGVVRIPLLFNGEPAGTH